MARSNNFFFEQPDREGWNVGFTFAQFSFAIFMNSETTSLQGTAKTGDVWMKFIGRVETIPKPAS